MRKLFGILGVLALMLASVQAAQAQTNANPAGAAVVNQSGSRGDAAMRCDTATSGAVNILTLQNPGAGLSQYVTYLGHWGLVSGSVVTAAATAFSSTGITGSAPSFQPISNATTATLVTGAASGAAVVMNPPLKTNTNVAVTLGDGAANAGITSMIQACYYTSP